MNVSELIAILQQRDPLSTVVVSDFPQELAFVEVRTCDTVTMCAFHRKGMRFLGSWGEDWSHPDGKTDVMPSPVLGVLLE